MTIRSIDPIRSILPYLSENTFPWSEPWEIQGFRWGFRILFPDLADDSCDVAKSGTALDIYINQGKVMSVTESTYEVDKNGYSHFNTGDEVYTA